MNFRNQVECYQAIGAALSQAAPAGWLEVRARIKLHGERVDAVVSYMKSGSNEVGYLVGVPMLARYFYELAGLVSTEEKSLFKECEFILLASGKYDACFTY